MKKIVYKECPYCKSTNLGFGYQTDTARMMCGVSGVFGSLVEHTICKDCGSIIYSKVEKPEMFKAFDEKEKN